MGKPTEMIERRRKEELDLCAIVLDRYERSPYSYPANEYQSVDGQSTLKGSWVAVESQA